MTEDNGLPDAGEAFFNALLDDNPVELYENAPCGYLSTLPDGTIVKANETFFGWTGYRREELIGRRRFQELLAPGDRIFYETHYAPMLRMQGSVREIAVEIVAAHGSRLPVLANSVVQSGDGETEIVRTVLFDARERRAYEAELLRARRIAEESEAEARTLADTLRSSFTPPVEFSIPGIDIGGAFRPAAESLLGGDFYDVVATGRGTHAIVLGDVSGKGVGAAVVTALVRHVVRSAVLRTTSPREVLRLAHETLVRDHPERFCTALLVDVDTKAARATVAAAGHQLPIIVSGGEVRRVGRVGSILGMLADTDVDDVALQLMGGEVLVMYTDGVSEARSDHGFFGDERVESLAVGAVEKSATDIASLIADEAAAFQNGKLRDDIAVVVVKVPAGVR